ncbi:MAG: hypothetical protein WKF57_04045 [Nakamurella sp.]
MDSQTPTLSIDALLARAFDSTGTQPLQTVSEVASTMTGSGAAKSLDVESDYVEMNREPDDTWFCSDRSFAAGFIASTWALTVDLAMSWVEARNSKKINIMGAGPDEEAETGLWRLTGPAIDPAARRELLTRYAR